LEPKVPPDRGCLWVLFWSLFIIGLCVLLG